MEIPKTFDYMVYFPNGDFEQVKDAWIGVQSAEKRTIFLDKEGQIKAVYMDSAVSRIIRYDWKA